ncbi:hypothetical protein KCU89_g19, partial [Aureobasidium melanogenum]
MNKHKQNRSAYHQKCKVKGLRCGSMHRVLSNLPIGTETPTNFPLSSAGPVCGTKLPSKIPIAIANMIQTARKRSNQPRPLIADTLSGSIVSSIFCLSTSVGGL